MPLSPASKEFVRTHLGSLIQLDTALLLQSDADVWWSAVRVSEQLRISLDSAHDSLERLAAGNLLDVRIGNDLTYRFAPWHQSAADVMNEIADQPYEAREIAARVASSKVAERFAEAFRVRKTDG